MGYPIEVLRNVFKISFISLLYFYTSSKLLGFCICHRMFIHYMFYCNLISVYVFYWGGFPSTFFWDFIRIIAGCVLLEILIKHKHDYHLKVCKEHTDEQI